MTMPTVEIPTAWLLVCPTKQHVDGWYSGVRADGSIAAATAEQAWKKLAQNAKERRELERDGWTIRAKGDEEKIRAELCTCAPAESSAQGGTT
jgi:hypothetical protein